MRLLFHGIFYEVARVFAENRRLLSGFCFKLSFNLAAIKLIHFKCSKRTMVGKPHKITYSILLTTLCCIQAQYGNCEPRKYSNCIKGVGGAVSRCGMSYSGRRLEIQWNRNGLTELFATSATKRKGSVAWWMAVNLSETSNCGIVCACIENRLAYIYMRI